MMEACTGVPPGELILITTPAAFLSLNASYNTGSNSSAEKLLSGAIMPSKRINATYLPDIGLIDDPEWPKICNTKYRINKNQAIKRIFFQKRSFRLSFNKSWTNVKLTS